jgi:predicted TIM-barrel fold metal-dependent hydrolase
MSIHRIDMHVHIAPPQYVAGLRRSAGQLPSVREPTLDGLLAVMERFEIDAAVVSGGPPAVFFGDQVQANELARAANEELAEIVRSNPLRLGALAFLPLPDVDAALAELQYALDVLKLDGVALVTNVDGRYLGDPIWHPLFDELHRRHAYVFVHPTVPPYSLPLREHPVWLYELPHETTRAIVKLLYSGTLDRCPDIRFQFSHLGGTAPFLAYRIASLVQREPSDWSLPAAPLAYLSRLYYDTGLSNHAPALAATLEVAPLERIVFGSDWPYAALPEEGSDPAPDLGWLGPERRARVEHANAAALVPRLGKG